MLSDLENFNLKFFSPSRMPLKNYFQSVIMSQLLLYKFFKRKSVLPNPSSPLSRIIPASCIEAANKTVKDIVVLEAMVSTSSDGPEASMKK